MGVFTWVDKPLGLSLSPRLNRILEQVRKGETPDLQDMEFLIDESARFDTIAQHIRTGEFKVEDTVLNDAYDIKEVLGDLVTELENLYAHNTDRNGDYHCELRQFRDIEKLSTSQIETEVRSALSQVRDLQKSFIANENGWKVKATFKYLKEQYRLNLVVTAETRAEDILPVIATKVLSVLEEDAKKKIATIKRLKGLTT